MSTSPEPRDDDAQRATARRAVLPWVAAALILAGVALVIGYVILTRPPER